MDTELKSLNISTGQNECNGDTYRTVGGKPRIRWPRMCSTPAWIGTWQRILWLKLEYKIRGQSAVDPCWRCCRPLKIPQFNYRIFSSRERYLRTAVRISLGDN